MSARDLLRDPIWRGEELGRPIPDSPHAVSVALPRWQDVVGYEEGRPEVIARLATGYPRFVVHPLVRALVNRLAGESPCLPFPSLRVAELCALHPVVQRETSAGRVRPWGLWRENVRGRGHFLEGLLATYRSDRVQPSGGSGSRRSPNRTGRGCGPELLAPTTGRLLGLFV
jgi:hypothetical protein